MKYFIYFFFTSRDKIKVMFINFVFIIYNVNISGSKRAIPVLLYIDNKFSLTQKF